MKITYNPESEILEIQDNVKSLLNLRRIFVTVILISSIVKIFITDWNNADIDDYFWILFLGIFAFIFVRNFFFKTSNSHIPISEIKYYKKNSCFLSKQYLQLTNGKFREFTELRTTAEKDEVYEILSKLGVKMVE